MPQTLYCSWRFEVVWDVLCYQLSFGCSRWKPRWTHEAEVNKRQLSQTRLCPSLSVLNRSRSETNSQVLHLILGQVLLLAHCGWIFTSAQFLYWFPDLACCLLWKSQWELLVGPFLLMPFSDDIYNCPCFTGECCQLCSLFQCWTRQFKHPEPTPGPELLGFCFCCSSWECTVSGTPLVSPTWKWSSTQSPAYSGVPKHAGNCVSTKRETVVHVNWKRE